MDKNEKSNANLGITVRKAKNILTRIPEQVSRLLIVVLIVVVVLLLLRLFIFPADITNTPLHIKQAVDRNASREIEYAGAEVCNECHDGEYSTIKKGYHKNLSCEVCHEPAKMHADAMANGDEAVEKPVIPAGREFCSVCHSYSVSKPTGFPQINPDPHNPLKSCVLCHNPHDPTPLETPRECSACHAGIAKTKSLSHHVSIECTVCHTTPDEHKITPRLVKPTKPDSREFCGKCHSKNTTDREAPKIDIDTHEKKYVCWQCHYPHMPEVR